MARLRFEGVSHRYGASGPWVLRDMHLDVADGEAHALLGPSGAGKSTLLNLLSGLLSPTSGTVLLDDRDVTTATVREREIAQVFQFPVVYEGLDVRGNLAFPLRNRGMKAPLVRSRVEAVAELMELTHLLAARPASLSAYDRQKTAMARALVRPDVAAVLLDEPLTAVEPTAKWRLRRALKSVQRELGLTMIYVTHDQLEALTFADRVSVIEGGRILQTATPAELVEEPAHAFVGHFIGSPGMNLLAVERSGAGLRVAGRELAVRLPRSAPEGTCQLGFRAEDGIVAAPADGAGPATPGALPVTIEAVRPLGLRAGRVQGMVTARLDGTLIHLRQAVDDLVAGPAELRVPTHRLRLFVAGARVAPEATSAAAETTSDE
ncbi:MAG TPA: ABC transporter ATP-binding protein [Pseudomonadales bacterium]|nr:ABC transporter ATP-binding protein [Pseudomonadales bacterium]